MFLKPSCMVAVLLSCVAAAHAEGWRSEVLFQSDFGLNGVAIGDLDPNCPGNEVATVNQAGQVCLIRRQDGEWQAEVIYQATGELLMCSIGDVDLDAPGNELVAVGMLEGPETSTGKGQAVMVSRLEEGWNGQQIFEDSHLIHGVAIGDVSGRYAGNEVILAAFNHRVRVLSLSDGWWRNETAYVANDRLKVAATADILPDRPGDELLATGMDGQPQLIWEGPFGWCHETVYSDAKGQSRIMAGELGVLIGGDGGKVTLATRGQQGWTADCLGRDTHKMRGVGSGDVDDRKDGAEAYACGYSGRVTQFWPTEDGRWSAEVIFTDSSALHHLLVGEFDRRHAGPEVLTCGHSGKLIELYPEL